MIERSKVEASVLDDACEDYHGLYEILWSLNTAYPSESDEAKLQVAQVALAGLVKRGLVAIYTGWPSGPYSALPLDRAQEVISTSSCWSAPAGSSTQPFCFAATDAGERAYYSGKAEAP